MTVAWRTSLVVATAAVTAAALGGCQSSEAAPPAITAPMRIVNNRPIVDAQVVTASGRRSPIRLLVDTAGVGVRFTKAAARRAGLETGKRMRRAEGVFATTSIEALRIRGIDVDLGGADPLIAIEPNDDDLDGVDAAIGADVLQRYGRVTLHYLTERVVLGEPASAPAVGALVPTRFDDGRFTARITLGTKTHRLVVDTGSVTTDVTEDVPIRITGTRQGVWGRVVLAPFEVVSDPDFESAADGLLGANLLARYTLRFNYERGTLRISTT